MLRLCAYFVLACLPLAALADPAGAIRVIDADTWDVGGERVRIFGIDAPEADQTCTRHDGSDWTCGAWATDQARARYEGRQADCDTIETDRYGRTVARCMVEGQDAGRVLVQEGLAVAFRRYSMDYDLDEKAAHLRGAGIHAGLYDEPSDYRAAQAQARTEQPAPGDCAIKGNVSSKGTRIYHMPGQENYAVTRISPAKGERWFCSEAEAQAAGWRRAKR